MSFGVRRRPSKPNHYVISTLILIALVSLSLPALAQENPVVFGEMGAKLDEYMTRLEGVGFSGAVIVAKDGTILLQRGYGLADREQNRPVRPSTVFTIGSITKQFTGAAILKLEMMGRLSTDDPIKKYFTNVPEDKAGITLHHLLTHTAGLPGAIGDDFDLSATADRFLEQAMNTELLSEPGERYRYSNVGFSLLGIIVEKVSGQPYEEFLQEHLFQPAGMTRTGYLLPVYTDEELAVGYRNDQRWGSVIQHPMLEDGPCWHLRANGGIHSTVGDMYRWHLALEGDEILSEKAKEKYFSPYADEGGGQSYYGYGWSIVPDYMGTRLITHNGGNGIFSADFRRFVDKDVVIFTASNLSEFAPVDYVSRDLSRAIFGHPYNLPPKTISIDLARLASYEGTYRLSSGATIEAQVEAGRLLLTGSGAQAGDLLAGGSGEGESPLIAGLNERSEDILRRSMQGDFTGLQEAFGGGIPLERIEAQEQQWMEMREQRYGKFVDLEAVSARQEGGQVSVFLRIDYEQGSGYIQYDWEGGELAGIELIREVPGAEARVYPVSHDEFESFSLRSPVSIHVEFEIGAGRAAPVALLFHTAVGKVRAERIN